MALSERDGGQPFKFCFRRRAPGHLRLWVSSSGYHKRKTNRRLFRGIGGIRGIFRETQLPAHCAMAPIDYSRFDNIDTSSDTDDDAEDANIEELLAEVEDGFSPEDVLDMASIIDSAVMRTFGGDVLPTDVLPPLHIRAGDSMFDGIARRIREYEDARPQRRRVALVANDVNDRFFPPILPKKKSKSHSTPPGKQKQKKPRLPCVGCGAPARKKCSGCHKLGVDTRYCAASCQRDHWPRHRRECGTKHPEIVAKMASPIPGLPRDVVLTHILASPACIADPGDLARLSAVSRAMHHAVRETKRPVYERSCVYFYSHMGNFSDDAMFHLQVQRGCCSRRR